MNRVPTDRPVRTIGTDDGKTYHVYAVPPNLVAVLCGCHVATLTRADARVLAEALLEA